MKRKRLLTGALAIIMTCALMMAGCGKKDSKSEKKTEETSTTIAETTTAKETTTAEETTVAKFAYQHDPTKNPSAMEDIIVNEDAVYGFSPNPDSTRLGDFAQYNWTDEAAVAEYKQNRLDYHKSIESMYTMLRELNSEGKSVEEMARAISEERNRIRLEAYKDSPEDLEVVKKSNLETYGNENGPTPESLYEKYGSWEMVLQKAFGTNAGMDACCGLYDDYYTLYVELGLVEE